MLTVAFLILCEIGFTRIFSVTNTCRLIARHFCKAKIFKPAYTPLKICDKIRRKIGSLLLHVAVEIAMKNRKMNKMIFS